MKKVLSLLLIILTILTVTACGMIDDVINPHDCENVCAECGKCTNADCTEKTCADKCGGHHKCESVCEECNKCTDTTCNEYACTDKCGGHHECESVCEECNKCTDATCPEYACTDKCGGHHKCESVCIYCGKCADTACAEDACKNKCGGHHKCQSACKECSKCTDTACAEDACKDKCGGHHKCESACAECNKCTDTACTEDACKNKCKGHHKCESICKYCGKCADTDCKEKVCEIKCDGSIVFPSGDFIVNDKYKVTFGDIVLNVEDKAFIKGNLQDILTVAVDTLEKVTGHKFINGKNYSNHYYDQKVHYNVNRESLYANQDGYTGDPYNETGTAYAYFYEHAVLSPGDIMPGNFTIVHELAHVHMFKQTDESYCQLLTEGYAEYSTYLVLKTLEAENPAYRIEFKPSEYYFVNLKIDNYDKLYEHPIEYWFDNYFEYAFNGNYAVGFRFMWYLDTVYGSYTKWLDTIDDMYPGRPKDSEQATVDQQIEALKAAYGDDVLDGFYPWLKENEDIFEAPKALDYTKLSGAINIYPTFDGLGPRIVLENIEYTDLYINIDSARYYLEEYKNFDASKLTLFVTGVVPTVELYKADGSFVTVKLNKPVSLKDISYIKLVGTGKAERIKIAGFTPKGTTATATHTCESICSECNRCTNVYCWEYDCRPKCSGHN